MNKTGSTFTNSEFFQVKEKNLLKDIINFFRKIRQEIN